MRNYFIWIAFLVLPCALVWSRPTGPDAAAPRAAAFPVYNYEAQNIPKQESSEANDEQVISVRITSSVAVGRGKGKKSIVQNNRESKHDDTHSGTTVTEGTSTTTLIQDSKDEEHIDSTPKLSGPNLEFIKQLHSRKEARGLHNFEAIHSFQPQIENEYTNETSDSIADSSIATVSEVVQKGDENIDNVPLGRSVALSPSSNNYIQGLTQKSPSERGNSPLLTTVSFNVVHESTKATNTFNEPSKIMAQQPPTNPPNFYETPKIYNEPSKVYSQPAQIYSEPAKFYSEPAKIYSEPAKIYSEPAKIYSEPAKVYSEPAKFYSQPASLHLPVASAASAAPAPAPWTASAAPPARDHQPEKNYEVDEKVSILTDGQSHGEQEDGPESNSENCKQENCKVGYVVEGRQYRKYRVEERTSDGFLVGEYGVVRNEDGALRGVRYTADRAASPRLIYDALMKFLQLK